MRTHTHPKLTTLAFAIRTSLRASAAALLVSGSLAVGSVSAQTQARGQVTTPPAPVVRAPASGALVGTLGPAATRALDKQSNASERRASDETRRRTNQLLRDGYVPIVVPDAPVYSRGGSTLLVEPVSPPVVIGNGWYPTAEPPTWRVVPDEHPVQAWRTVDVDDVLCNANGACFEQTTRVNARWAAALRAYAFADRLGRVWLVE